jgi:hypothetical protein
MMFNKKEASPPPSESSIKPPKNNYCIKYHTKVGSTADTLFITKGDSANAEILHKITFNDGKEEGMEEENYATIFFRFKEELFLAIQFTRCHATNCDSYVQFYYIDTIKCGIEEIYYVSDSIHNCDKKGLSPRKSSNWNIGNDRIDTWDSYYYEEDANCCPSAYLITIYNIKKTNDTFIYYRDSCYFDPQ